MILASASQTRSRILSSAGVAHDCIASNIDETKIKNAFKKKDANVETVAIALAEAKASAVAKNLISLKHTDFFIISADQILECEGRWFDKPSDQEAAQETLLALRGKTHHLVSAATVFHREKCIWRYIETPVLRMRNFSDQFLASYLQSSTSKILESVGAYRLESSGVQLFADIDGDYFTILGLPLLALLAFLREMKILAE